MQSVGLENLHEAFKLLNINVQFICVKNRRHTELRLLCDRPAYDYFWASM